MAGLGRKIFNSGDILLASEVQGFLQDQAVMVFDDDAARTAAIPTPTEGMVTFRKDDNALEVFDGSTFVAVGGGSESGLVHIETADINGLSAFSFNNVFTSTFDNYRVLFNIFSTENNLVVNIRLRASGTDESGSRYNLVQIFGNGSTAVSTAQTAQTSFTIGTSTDGNESIYLADILSPALTQNALGIGNEIRSTSGIGLRQFRVTNTTAYDGITLFVATGNITSGKVSIYGYRK